MLEHTTPFQERLLRESWHNLHQSAIDLAADDIRIARQGWTLSQLRDLIALRSHAPRRMSTFPSLYALDDAIFLIEEGLRASVTEAHTIPMVRGILGDDEYTPNLLPTVAFLLGPQLTNSDEATALYFGSIWSRAQSAVDEGSGDQRIDLMRVALGYISWNDCRAAFREFCAERFDLDWWRVHREQVLHGRLA